jgi:Tol biopolymer transport system component
VFRKGIRASEPTPLTDAPYNKFVDVVTADGKWLLYAEVNPKTRFDLRLFALDRTEPTQKLLATQADERNADLSPDGRWIAYQSDESSRFEVYVRPFPRVEDGRLLVSTNGGARPLWSKGGRELFFLGLDRQMMVVSVERSSTLTVGRPRVLFDISHLGLEGQQRNFDLPPDGKRFMMVKDLPPPADVPSMVLIQHWFEELRAKVH